MRLRDRRRLPGGTRPGAGGAAGGASDAVGDHDDVWEGARGAATRRYRATDEPRGGVETEPWGQSRGAVGQGVIVRVIGPNLERYRLALRRRLIPRVGNPG